MTRRPRPQRSLATLTRERYVLRRLGGELLGSVNRPEDRRKGRGTRFLPRAGGQDFYAGAEDRPRPTGGNRYRAWRPGRWQQMDLFTLPGLLGRQALRMSDATPLEAHAPGDFEAVKVTAMGYAER